MRFKAVLSVFLDLIVSFMGFGYLVAYLTGNLKNGGFALEGAPALCLFALMIAYFVVMNKLAGGTIGKKIFGLSRKKGES
ncbi:MAG: hypothetical protein S4CHLAM102_02040 [Chlamydiia bacterium]|nr:hypothetical protein [Chlamydiia bacterium]